MTSTAPFHVLIIEDSPEDRADLRQMLLRGSQRHYRFTEAETGGAGLRAVRKKTGAPPDCVLLDFNLPDMNALDVLKDLCVGAALPPCPVVVVTGSNSNSGSDVLRAGAQDYIGKEWITPGSLTRTVENAVERFALVQARDVAQLALEASEARLDLGIRVAGLGLAVVDYVTGLNHLSEESARQFGLGETAVAVPRERVHATFHPDDRAVLMPRIAESLNPAGDGWFAMVHRIVWPSGEVRWLRVRKQVHFDGEAGTRRPVRAMLATLDITERLRTEEALRESHILLDTLLTRAPIGICMLDRELRYVRINDLLASFNGIPAAAHVGRTVAEIVPTLEATVRAVTERILQTGEAISSREFCRETAGAPGGKRYWNESWYPVCDGEGKIVGFGGVVEEITARKQSEEAVARLAAIVESSYDALFGEDLDGIITSWNPGAEQIFGYRAEEVVGTSILRLIPTDQQPAEQELQREIVAGELGGTFEAIRLTKDGREFPASITIAPLKDAAGKVVGTSRVLRDITLRTRAEKALRENAALFSTLIAQAPMGTYVVDAQFRVLQVNAEAMPNFASVQPLVGRDFQEVLEILWGREVGGRIAGIFRHTLATGERYISPPFTEQRRDLGIEQTYEWETQRVTLPDAQHGVVCYFHEVTERAHATAALRESQERMRLAAEATGVGIWEWNVLTNAIRWDALMFQIYGIEPTPDGLVNYRDWSGAVLPEDLAENEAILQDTVRRAGRSIREFRIRRRSDGERRHIRAVETVRKNAAGQIEWVVGTNLDITERKAASLALHAAKDVAEQANASKDRFLAVLSHELRTPLNPVLMAVAALEENPELRPEVREDLAMIRRNVELETRLIDDLFDLSRITSGKLELRSQAVDLNESVCHVCGICRPQLLEKGVRLETDLGVDVGFIPADPARLQQILWNVLKNAVKFTPAQGTVQVRTVRLGPDRCEVRVEDSGIGIPAGVLSRIFDAFEQGEAHITRQFGGLGLGLAISRALVELHGGTIRAESAGPGQGATFSIELPGQPARLVPVPTPDAAGAPAPDGPLRILLVEDHADTARTLARLLRRAGFEVTTASDVAGGVAAAEREALDLLVSDLGLPDGTGHDLMRAVRAKRPLPGIAMSGYGMREDLRRSQEAGFAEHLVKPVTLPDLIAAIRRVVGMKADVATTDPSRR